MIQKIYAFHNAVIIISIYIQLISISKGDLEPTFARCCALGANWAREGQICNKFPAPVPGEPSEHQSICLTAASICCLRYYREAECESAKQAAKSGFECTTSSRLGGEFFQDCCDGCKLGLIIGSMAMQCAFQGFSFGFPWNDAYLECCIHASPPGSVEQSVLVSIPSSGDNDQHGNTGTFPDLEAEDENFIFVNRIDGDANIPDSENLCLLFPGQLCGHVCVPTRGSYICQCRVGFTISVDGKTCIQDQVKDRCEVNNPCDHICRDTGVSIECSCNVGYQLAPNQRSCSDIDECSIGSHTCGPIENCINTQGSYDCQLRENPSDCPPGYKFNSQTKICEDIDECSEGLDDCSDFQTCLNSDGSFRCIHRSPACDFGFTYDNKTMKCTDIDECGEGLHLCSRTREICFNLPGAYRCDRIIETRQNSTRKADPPKNSTEPISSFIATTNSPTTALHAPNSGTTTTNDGNLFTPPCPDGYNYDRSLRRCKDIDECLKNPCDQHELCINSEGAFTCECKDGFARDTISGDCKDVNECQLGLHTCERLQRCDNTLGSYTCTRLSGCGTGYTLNHNNGKCEDDDECALGTNDCRQLGPKWKCVNTKGSFRCERKACPPKQLLNSWGQCVNISCTPGYKPSDKKCVDINECTEGESPCKKNERCFNYVGSYECRPKINCGRGYKMNEVGNQCIDTDECADLTHTCTGGQLCTNRPGGYVCQCPRGYRLDLNRQCQDINECKTAYARLCGNTGECENTPGSYRCNCKTGYKKSPNGQTCIDIDECSDLEGVCEHNCVNIWGSHYCTCNSGYKLSSNNRTCDDINECEEVRGKGRLCLGICTNTPGSFKCTCPKGYNLEEDQRTCKDINECDTVGTCRNPEDICVNTRGNFRCQTITCPPNYVRDPNHKNRCKKEKLCPEDNMACLQKPLTYSYNFLPMASNMTLKPLGQVDLFTMRGPLWSSTNVQFSLELESASSSKEGVTTATRNYFLLNRTAFNQVILTLIKSLEGPQEVLLSLNMKLFHNGFYEGSAVAKLLIFVSDYDF